MRKILAIVLVVAFVLGLGSVALATDQNDTEIVDGWGSFYSLGEAEVELVRPVLYDSTAVDNRLWVDIQLQVEDDGHDQASGYVEVYHLTEDGVTEKDPVVAATPFTDETHDAPFRVEINLADNDLEIGHVILVKVDEDGTSSST